MFRKVPDKKMFRKATGFSLPFVGGQPALEPGEEVALSALAKKVVGNVDGLLTLTDRRLIFEPRVHDVRVLERQRVNFPLGAITILRLEKPLLGGSLMLRVGQQSYESDYQVHNAEEWLEAIERLRGGTGTGLPTSPTSAPDVGLPATPPPQAGMPPCPVCGSVCVRQPDRSLTCPQCSSQS